MKTQLLQGGTIVTETNKEVADVLIVDGKIEKLAWHDAPNYSLPTTNGGVDEVIDATGKLLFPGLIDCHVHFREPGLTQKGDMKSESTAACAGGVTTVCDMPNTVPPTVTIAALKDKVERAERITKRLAVSGQRSVDIRFFFGITEHEHLKELEKLWIGTTPELHHLRARCCGVKLYLDHSTGDQRIIGGLIDDVFHFCTMLKIPIVCHCEEPGYNDLAARQCTRTDIASHSLRRPPDSEAAAIAACLGLVSTFRTQFHVAHLSTKEGLDLVRQAKRGGLPVTCEVAPHHLFLSTDDYTSLGALAKMNPPLRTKDHQEALWEGLKDGTVDCIATDHAPHTLEEKQSGDPLEAPSGVPGVETMLPLLLTVATGHLPGPALQTTNYKLQTQDIVRLCFENPNRIFSLGKLGIREGAPADIILVDSEKEWVIHGKDLHSKCGWTPYEGWKVRGRVENTL